MRNSKHLHLEVCVQQRLSTPDQELDESTHQQQRSYWITHRVKKMSLLGHFPYCSLLGMESKTSDAISPQRF